MAYDNAAADRVRRILPTTLAIVEKRMMGALIFMAEDRMCCGVTGTDLMVRIGPSAYQSALKELHVRPMEVGRRKPGAFILVDQDG